MPIEVEFLIFPGLRNPRYILSGPREETCLARLQALQIAGATPPEQIRQTASGYRGMHLRFVEAPRVVEPSTVEPQFRVFARRLESRDTVVVDPERALEQWLFENAPASIRRQAQRPFADLARDADELLPIENLDGLGNAQACDDALPFPVAPTPWETGLTLNNCYNYAQDRHTNDWACPGDVSHALSCDELQPLIEEDGGTPLNNGFPHACAADAHLILLCLVDPKSFEGNFHFFRLDEDGVWSHKFGIDPVKNVDDDGNAMTDIRAARFAVRLVACKVFEFKRT